MHSLNLQILKHLIMQSFISVSQLFQNLGMNLKLRCFTWFDLLLTVVRISYDSFKTATIEMWKTKNCIKIGNVLH